MVARRGHAPAKKSDGGTARGCAGEKWAMGCASLDRQRWCSEGMRWPKWAMVVRRGDALAKWSNTKLVGWRRMHRQMKRPNRRGMRRPSETTPNRWRLGGECAGQMKQHQIGGGLAGNAPAKWNNTKSVDRQRMHWQTNRCSEEIAVLQWDAPAGQRECGAAMRCAGRTKRPWLGDGMHRPNKETAAR